LPGQRRIFVTEYEFGAVESYDVASDGLPLLTNVAAAAM
jgi:hypothetical protein